MRGVPGDGPPTSRHVLKASRASGVAARKHRGVGLRCGAPRGSRVRPLRSGSPREGHAVSAPGLASKLDGRLPPGGRSPSGRPCPPFPGPRPLSACEFWQLKRK